MFSRNLIKIFSSLLFCGRICQILTINKTDFYHVILTRISINLNLNLDNHEGILRTIVDVNSHGNFHRT